jgi:uncharacterized protein (DUF983 family)
MAFSLRYILLVVGMLQVGLATFAGVVTDAPLPVTIGVTVASAVLAVVLAALEKLQTAPTPQQVLVIGASALQAGITAWLTFASALPRWEDAALVVASAMLAFALNQLPSWDDAPHAVLLRPGQPRG